MKNRYTVFLTLFFITVSSLQSKFEPESYHKSNVGQFKSAIKELHKLHLSGSEKILDIGSGDGRTSSYIAKEYIPKGTLVGIDNSADMTAFSLSHNAAANIVYMQADAAEYMALNEYDAIVSFWTLHWVIEYNRALGNIAQSLKPGGKALLCHIVGVDPFQLIVDELLDTSKWNAYKKDIKLFNAPSLSQIGHAIEKRGIIY